MYLMMCTRPDLAYPLSLLARYVASGRHRKVHWDAAKRVLRYLCSTSGMGLVLEGRGPVVLTGHTDASWVDDSAMQWSSQGYTFSLGFGSVSWRSTHSSSVLSSSCEAEIYAGAIAALELRGLTYLLTDLGEQPRSPPVVYVDNKAMIALCQEHRLEHRTKHIALRYFLARELQQRGQLRLAYVATRANTTDIFTKALPPCDHQCFSTVLGLLALLFLTGLVTTCSPPLCLWGCSRPAAVGDADLGVQVDKVGQPAWGHCEAANDRKPATDFDCGRRKESSTWEGRRLGNADLGKPTWCSRLIASLVDLELVDLGSGRLGKVGWWSSTWVADEHVQLLVVSRSPNTPINCEHLRSRCTALVRVQRCAAALLQRWHAVDLQRWQVATLHCWSAVDFAALECCQP
ncbi:unnamed protein product [Closterium sp. NIES-53]